MDQNTAASTGLSLSGFLNILWRRRMLIVVLTALGAAAGILYGIVVTPLYRASTTIQPGVTHYDIEGRPERQWRIRDIVQWYKRGDFNPSVARTMGEDSRTFLPIIRASFLPRGPQSRGGNTITLTTLDPDPVQASDILDASVQVFLEFAGSDTLYSDVHLQRVQTSSNLAREQAQLDQIDGKLARVEMQIEAATLALGETKASRKLTQAQIAEKESARELIVEMLEAYRLAIGTVDNVVEAMDGDVERWVVTSDALIARRDALLESRNDPVAMALYTQGVNGLLAELNTLRLGIVDQTDRVLDWQSKAKQLTLDINQIDLDLGELRVDLEQKHPQRVLAAEQKILDLELQRRFDIGQEREDLVQDMRGTAARLRALTPLEQIGKPVASARPVRPRRLRAVLILMGLGLASSLFLAVGLEYVSRNWQDITRPNSGA